MNGAGGGGGTDFLYPFIEGTEDDAQALLDDLAASAAAKAAASLQLRSGTLAACGDGLAAAADDVADRLAAGGRLLTFGNGGSATDAAQVAALFATPPWGTPLAARSLVADEAVVTALGNDIGFDLVFERQLTALGRPGDVAMGFSTSGNSDNVLRAFAGARRRGLGTVGVAGTDGGRMAASADIDHCFVVRSDSVHRIQEAQDALSHELWRLVQRRVGATRPEGNRHGRG